MYTHQYLNTNTSTNTGFAAAANHSAYTAPHTPMQQTFGPTKLVHLDATRQYLGNASLTESYLLQLSQQAILYGFMEQQYSEGVVYNRIAWNGLVFVLSQSFDAVQYIAYDTAKVVPAKPQPQALTQPQTQPEQVFYCAEDSEEYERMINRIVDSVDKDMQADYAVHAYTFYSAPNELKMQTPPPSAAAAPPSHASQDTASRKSASPSPPPACGEYHNIYLKPIMERLAKSEPTAQVTGDFVAEIVSSALRMGVKRQISKRTFSFSWDKYTVVMSKSLKTILDVAVSREGQEVITVHPDVVSILAKKCPSLDYFAIQRVAERAKQSGKFTTKKNDYRQQFIYDFAGYRIVFASNHSMIVEMQLSEQTPSTAAVAV